MIRKYAHKIDDLLCCTYHLQSWWTCHGQRRNWSTLVGCEGRSGADGISNIVEDLWYTKL